jgi:hypothetical protein
MTGRIAALVLFGFLGLLASRAWGQDCIPVVYAFRHAEDSNPAQIPPTDPPQPLFTLTPTGIAHAELYKRMIGEFEAANFEATNMKPCPVTKVYAATTKDKENTAEDPCLSACKSATNAFETAKPLAIERMGRGANPLTTVANGTLNLPLYEYVGNGNKAPENPNYSTTTATALRTELLATANLQLSSAIFWTSQGLHVLGGAIINKKSNVPVKAEKLPPPAPPPPPSPPRNAVYIFTALGRAPNITGFSDTPLTKTRDSKSPAPPWTVYVQCFNWVGATDQPNITPHPVEGFIPPDGNPSTQRFYCGYNELGNVGGSPDSGCHVGDKCGKIPNDRNEDIQGKICNTDTMLEGTAGTNMFGACERRLD